MMNFIMVPTIFGIITLGIYKLFELFVCKKERLLIIEKMSDKLDPNMLDGKIKFPSVGNASFSALKTGSLLMGIGLGLLVAFLICALSIENYLTDSKTFYKFDDMIAVIYAASVLLFGGLGLVVAFIVELKQKK